MLWEHRKVRSPPLVSDTANCSPEMIQNCDPQRDRNLIGLAPRPLPQQPRLQRIQEFPDGGSEAGDIDQEGVVTLR